jgi:Ca2+-binding EF-hand superfamily protein
MSHRNTLLAVGLVAATLTGTAFAQAAKPAAAKPASAPANGQVGERATPEMVFNAWDKDKNKSLSLDEFKAGWTEIQQRQVIAKLHQNFVAMDTNKSGTLEQDEFAKLEIIKKAGAKAPMMSAFDADKNGKLEFKEYVEMIASMMKTAK